MRISLTKIKEWDEEKLMNMKFHTESVKLLDDWSINVSISSPSTLVVVDCGRFDKAARWTLVNCLLAVSRMRSKWIST